MNSLYSFSRHSILPTRCAMLLQSLLLGVSIAGIGTAPLTAHAQTAIEARSNWNIPAGPLDAALARFATDSGTNLSFEPELVAGRNSGGVSGNYTVTDALNRLLTGSGVSAERSGSGVFRLQRAATDAAVTLPKMKVQANAEPSGELLQAYAGNQVARGGGLGILGNRDLMDTPFNQTNYTASLMQDQQVHHIADVLHNDPSARANASTSTGADDFSIRGFYVGNPDILFNGMVGVAPTFFNSMMAESVERVEVLKGPNALLNGVAQNGSVGGVINVIPKRALEEALTQFTADYSQDSQLGGHADISRRYGEHKEFGVRFNGVYRDGDSNIDDQSRESKLAAFGLDYRSERVRVNADFGYQAQDFRGIRDFTSVNASTVTRMPDVPDSNSNYDGPHDFNDVKVYYGALRSEFDVNDQLTVFAAAGGNERSSQYILNNRTIGNNAGDLEPYEWAGQNADRMYARTLEGGARGRFATGAVQHQAVLAYTTFDRDWRRVSNGYTLDGFNIFNPTPGAEPGGAHPDSDDAVTMNTEKLTSTTLTDTLTMLDEKILLTVGVRHQSIEDIWRGNGEEDEATSPMAGLVVKPGKDISVYANYIEGLQPGMIVGSGYENEGEVFEPYATKQYEAGVKKEFGKLGMTLSLYQISQPTQFVEDNVYREDGEQRHRGIDLNFYGELRPSLRVLGGVAYINSEQTNTQDGLNDGNEGVGVPEWRVILGSEWDTPFLSGLTLNGRINYNGSTYVNPETTLDIPDWYRLDIGARYRVNKTTVVRANVFNLLDEDYWDVNNYGQLTVSDPRTLSVSATFDF